MKQLSLLLLAGLTASCFAVQDTPCWDVICELAAHPDKVDTIHLMDGMSDCSNRYEQIKLLENNADLKPYREAISMVSSYLASRKAFLETKDELFDQAIEQNARFFNCIINRIK